MMMTMMCKLNEQEQSAYITSPQNKYLLYCPAKRKSGISKKIVKLIFMPSDSFKKYASTGLSHLALSCSKRMKKP